MKLTKATNLDRKSGGGRSGEPALSEVEGDLLFSVYPGRRS
jgi:hypothetical protein